MKKIQRPRLIFYSALFFSILLICCIGYMKYDMTRTANNQYSAVFLVNGQVYFGHLFSGHGDWMKLKDVYYFQMDENQGETLEDLSLIKLGSELHGPEDEMEIMKSNILFFEQLSSTSQVVEAIEEYKR
ncbi:hypothetical protein KJ766_01045 [Patescibacteria group bacterium]|nr:hypothetical protein [Patescibacteria group bacterium]